jgi:hypothetical protein
VFLWQTFGDPRALDAFWIAGPVTVVTLFAVSRVLPSGQRTDAARR